MALLHRHVPEYSALTVAGRLVDRRKPQLDQRPGSHPQSPRGASPVSMASSERAAWHTSISRGSASRGGLDLHRIALPGPRRGEAKKITPTGTANFFAPRAV